jgi:hypothetical protein
LLGIPGKPRDPGHRPHHHSPYAQNSLICLPKTRIVIDYRRRQIGGSRAVVAASGYDAA